MSLAFGGEAHYQEETWISSADLNASVGLQLDAGFAWRVFGIAAELRWTPLSADANFEGDDAVGSAFLFVVKPRPPRPSTVRRILV